MVDSPSLQFLPRRQEAQIWRLDEDPIVIPGDHLNTYLGAVEAPQFARYETLDVSIGKYSTPAGNGFATVEIFRFPDFVKAFGAYSGRKDGPVQYLNIPNEAFIKKYSIHLWRGPFYVRVTGGAAQNAGESLARLTSFVADPPERMASTPPASTVHALALPPEDTYWVPPLLTVTPMAVPPA